MNELIELHIQDGKEGRLQGGIELRHNGVPVEGTPSWSWDSFEEAIAHAIKWCERHGHAGFNLTDARKGREKKVYVKLRDIK